MRMEEVGVPRCSVGSVRRTWTRRHMDAFDVESEENPGGVTGTTCSQEQCPARRWTGG
jgi:hypothetical protein